MVLDRNGTARDLLVERLKEMMASGEVLVAQPRVAYDQMQHPHTPANVMEVMRPQIFTLRTTLTSDEQRCRAAVRKVMRGNAQSDQDDADASIIFEANGYLVTEDSRILGRRDALEAIPASAPVWIVTLAEFLAIFDRFEKEERELDRQIASLKSAPGPTASPLPVPSLLEQARAL
jgi:hypothetical protein